MARLVLFITIFPLVISLFFFLASIDWFEKDTLTEDIKNGLKNKKTRVIFYIFISLLVVFACVYAYEFNPFSVSPAV